MSDRNVIVLGAGFSAGAGIPMLGNFLETMMEIRDRKSYRGFAASVDLLRALDEALSIREELDGYHGRASFNDRNIEDIMSMLSFNVLGGGRVETKKLKKFVAAIAGVIELTCQIRLDNREELLCRKNEATSGVVPKFSSPAWYKNFWVSLFQRYAKTRSLPTIISFNYDLVLERSLLETVIGSYYVGSSVRAAPFDGINIDYGYKSIGKISLKVSNTNFRQDHMAVHASILGSTAARLDECDSGFANLEIIKLHGSLNFPENLKKSVNIHLTSTVENPFIVPPISNKTNNGITDDAWRVALNRIRTARNVTFVGYSLPSTDSYVRYFLKAAFGPNRDLNQIHVIDPNATVVEFGDRYRSCFSSQTAHRINFISGTAEYFSQAIGQEGNSFLY